MWSRSSFFCCDGSCNGQMHETHLQMCPAGGQGTVAGAGAAGTSLKDQKCRLWDLGTGSRPLRPVLQLCPSTGEGSHWWVSLAPSSRYPLQQASFLITGEEYHGTL